MLLYIIHIFSVYSFVIVVIVVVVVVIVIILLLLLLHVSLLLLLLSFLLVIIVIVIVHNIIWDFFLLLPTHRYSVYSNAYPLPNDIVTVSTLYQSCQL